MTNTQHKLVLIRHGQSQWNLENRFTGWKDVDLTDQGRNEAKEAGKLLKEQGFEFDIAYTSVLKRAIRTLWFVLDELDRMWIPVVRDYRLNERHYGGLQGLNKSETAEKYGEDQVHIWRRSFDTPPPLLEKSDERYPGNDPKYSSLNENELPLAESLKTTIDRVVPYFNETIAPKIKQGQKVIIAAHGNSLRALVKHLDGISDDEITSLNIPTGVPLVYELDENLKAINRTYLGNADEIKKAQDAVANQGKK